MLELNDRVKVVGKQSEFRGRTGHVAGLLYGRDNNNIGVDLDGDHYDPTIYYYSECELEKLRG